MQKRSLEFKAMLHQQLRRHKKRYDCSLPQQQKFFCPIWAVKCFLHPFVFDCARYKYVLVVKSVLLAITFLFSVKILLNFNSLLHARIEEGSSVSNKRSTYFIRVYLFSELCHLKKSFLFWACAKTSVIEAIIKFLSCTTLRALE